MQGNIAQALALTSVGNAFLRGRDVASFWPDASVFTFSKSCDFRVVDDRGDRLIAPDPLAWFETLRAECKGLRLHNATRPRAPGQSILVEERMMVGFVGGGPAWLIEAVGAERSQIWQGYDRLGDREDPERRIWLNTYLLEAETTPQDEAPRDLSVASQEVQASLAEIEELAERVKGMMTNDWGPVFRSAREALGAADPRAPYYEIGDFADFDLAQSRLYVACVKGWVFGGMGSWNDMVPPEAHAAGYEEKSERLFRALCDGVCALANSTYDG